MNYTGLPKWGDFTKKTISRLNLFSDDLLSERRHHGLRSLNAARKDVTTACSRRHSLSSLSPRLELAAPSPRLELINRAVTKA